MKKKFLNILYLILLLFAILPYDYTKLFLGKADVLSILLTYGIRLILFLYIIIYTKNIKLNPSQKKVFMIITLYFVFIFILNIMSSVFFNKTPINDLIKRTFSMTYLYGFYLYIIYNYKHFDIVHSKIKFVCLILLILSVLLYILYPNIGQSYEGYHSFVFLGIAENRNSYYELMIPAIVSIMFLKGNKLKKFDILMIITIIVTTVLTNSITSIIALITILLFLVLGKSDIKKTSVLKLSYIIVSIVWIMFFAMAMNNYYLSDISNMFSHKSSTLSGRTIIWEKAFYYIEKNPIIGYGYDNNIIGDKTNYMFQGNYEFPNDTHNSIIFMLLSSGIMGTVVLLYIIYSTLKKSLIVVRFDERYYYLCIFLVSNIVRGLTESCFHYPHIMFFVYIIMINIKYFELNEQSKEITELNCKNI